MPRRVLTKQTNFASGELDAALDGRTDLDRYYNGCRTMLNWYPVVQGGARRAPGTLFLDELFGATRLLAFEASDTDKYLFALRDQTLGVYQDGSLIQTLPTPWAEADLFSLDMAQALDTAVFVHEDYAPRRVYRNSAGTFFIEDLTDTANAIHLTTTPTEPILRRWFPGLYHFDGEYIRPSLSEENGKYYLCTQEGTSGSSAPSWPTVTTTPFSDGTAKWKLIGDVSDIEIWTAANGYPRACVFHEDRLVFAGSKSYPHRIWLSKTSDYFNFDLGTGLASDAIDREILADQLPVIQWVYSGRRLVIGASNSEFAVVQSNPITPSEMQIRKQSSVGSARVPPVDVDGAVLHLTANRSQLRELVYSDVEQAFTTRSLSTLSPRAVSNAIQLAVAPAVDYDDANLVYAVNGDGSVGVLNVLRDQEFLAWARRTFDGDVESVASVDGVIYVVVAYRYGPGVYEDGVYETGVYETSGSSSTRYLCSFSDAAFLDYQKTVTAATAKTNWTGFDHLAGASVSVLEDGAYAGEQTVTDAGGITSSSEVNTVTVGLPLPTPTLELMPVNFDGPQGSISHLMKRLVRALVQLSGAKSLTVNGDAINFREAQQNVFADIEPFTGVKDISLLGWDREAVVTLTAPEPMAVTVLSITREVAL